MICEGRQGKCRLEIIALVKEEAIGTAIAGSAWNALNRYGMRKFTMFRRINWQVGKKIEFIGELPSKKGQANY